MDDTVPKKIIREPRNCHVVKSWILQSLFEWDENDDQPWIIHGLRRTRQNQPGAPQGIGQQQHQSILAWFNHQKLGRLSIKKLSELASKTWIIGEVIRVPMGPQIAGYLECSLIHFSFSFGSAKTQL